MTCYEHDIIFIPFLRRPLALHLPLLRFLFNYMEGSKVSYTTTIFTYSRMCYVSVSYFFCISKIEKQKTKLKMRRKLFLSEGKAFLSNLLVLLHKACIFVIVPRVKSNVVTQPETRPNEKREKKTNEQTMRQRERKRGEQFDRR